MNSVTGEVTLRGGDPEGHMMSPRPILAVLALLFLWALVACAPALDRGVATVEKGAKVVDVSLDVAGTAWKAAVADRIAKCRAEGHATPEARRACMGRFADGDRVVPALEEASAAYDLLVEALKRLRAANEELAPYLEELKPYEEN